MAWEERGSKTYYYRKVRQAQGVHSEYVGTGLVGDLASQVDGIDRLERSIARLDLAEFIGDLRRVDQVLDAYRRQLRGVVADMLRALGFHQHKRQWRKARTMSDKVAKFDLPSDETPEFFRLYQTATKNPALLPQLKEFALAHPTVFDKAKLLSITTLASVLTTVKMSEISTITISGEIDALRRNLGADIDTPLEKLLIEDVVICWVRLQLMEQVYSQNVTPGVLVIAKVKHLERRLSATRHRCLQSVETLARVRRLLSRPRVQINIAQQQIVANG